MAPSMSLYDRDIGSDLGQAKTTFTTWDGCMAKAYCKYPVIIAIVVLSLILLSIILCFVRCCCLGYECCCGVCSCCNACCPSPRKRDKPSKFADHPGGYNQLGYQSHPPPQYSNVPQFATFESAHKSGGGANNVHADSLPAMPSWDTAKTHRVEDTSHQETHEMGAMAPHEEQKAPMLNHPGSTGGDAFAAGAVVPSPYSDQPNHVYHGAYGQQNPMNQYHGAAVATPQPARSPAPSSFAQQQTYGVHDPYAQSSYEHGYDHGYDQGHGYEQSPATYGVTAAPAPRVSPPTRSPTSPVQNHSGYSAPSALPGALQSGGTPKPMSPTGFGGYGSAYSQPKLQYTAYTPSETSTRYEPSSYSGGGDARRPGHGAGYHDV